MADFIASFTAALAIVAAIAIFWSIVFFICTFVATAIDWTLSSLCIRDMPSMQDDLENCTTESQLEDDQPQD
jgi:hypothetical protein